MMLVACWETLFHGSIQRGAAYKFLQRIPSQPIVAITTRDATIVRRRNRFGRVPRATPTGRITQALISITRFGWMIPNTVMMKKSAKKYRSKRLAGQEVPRSVRIRQTAVARPALTPATQYQGATDSLTNRQYKL